MCRAPGWAQLTLSADWWNGARVMSVDVGDHIVLSLGWFDVERKCEGGDRFKRLVHAAV